MMEIMMIRPAPKRDDALQAPGEIVARVSVNGLEETEHDPDVDGDDVEVGEEAEEEGTADGACAEDEDFEGVGVLGGLPNHKLAVSTEH